MNITVEDSDRCIHSLHKVRKDILLILGIKRQTFYVRISPHFFDHTEIRNGNKRSFGLRSYGGSTRIGKISFNSLETK
jgi:hypothetical protein